MDGAMEEQSAAAVTAILEERGYQVSAVNPLLPRSPLERLQGPLSWRDVHLFNQHLLAISRTGMPIVPALQSAGRELRRGRLRGLVDELRRDLEHGLSLSDSLDRQGGRLPAVYSAMLRAGERAGNLSGVLSIMHNHASRMLRVRNAMITAMAYPVVVLVCCLALMLFLLTKVVPQFGEVFSEVGASLPAPTRLWLSLANAFNSNLWELLGGLGISAALLIACIVLLRRYAGGSALFHGLFMIIPVWGRMFKVDGIARFTRTLGTLMDSSVPIGESCDLAAAASGNAVLRSRMREAGCQIANGEQLSSALGETAFFNHTYCWLLGAAEERGELVETLDELAQSYEEEAENLGRNAAVLLGPVLIILMGLVVGNLVVSLYLPLFTLGDAILG